MTKYSFYISMALQWRVNFNGNSMARDYVKPHSISQARWNAMQESVIGFVEQAESHGCELDRQEIFVTWVDSDDKSSPRYLEVGEMLTC